MVAAGDVSASDILGNDRADATLLRMNLIKVRRFWHSIMLELRTCMVAVCRIVVNHDGHGGTALDPMTLDKGGILEDRTPRLMVNVDVASMPGP